MPARVPSPYKPARPALVEPIQQPLNSSVVLPAAAPPSQALFFQTTQGSPGFNPVYTNMETQGQLSNPKIFVIRGFRLHVAQSLIVNGTSQQITTDLAPKFTLETIAESYWYRMFIGVKEYLRTPMFYVSSGLGVWASMAGAGGATPNTFGAVSALGAPHHSNYYKITRRPIVIPPQQNFQGELNLGPALASFAAPDARVWNFLEGDLGREVM